VQGKKAGYKWLQMTARFVLTRGNLRCAECHPDRKRRWSHQ